MIPVVFDVASLLVANVRRRDRKHTKNTYGSVNTPTLRPTVTTYQRSPVISGCSRQKINSGAKYGDASSAYGWKWLALAALLGL